MRALRRRVRWCLLLGYADAMNSFVSAIDRALAHAVDLAWGPPLLVLLVFGGLALTLYSRFLPFRALSHAIAILRGRYDDPSDPGEISHFQALAMALSSTIGLGNIGGVAIAISQGGPGAVFWMWVAAVVGMGTKFFSCTLAVLYRGEDSEGNLQGGPMYYIEYGLGRRWRFLAILFSVCGMVGCLAMFQANQMAEILEHSYGVERWTTGVLCVAVVGVVLLGGVGRIARVASAIVPLMCLIYFGFVVAIIALNADAVPGVLAMIVREAFTGHAAVGGAEGIAVATVIQTGIKRAAFSNEAGIGTAPMAHGAARTHEPVREGLVAMMGPAIDTLFVCTLTALAILTTDVWSTDTVRGVSMTMLAFESSLGLAGKAGLIVVVVMFGASTMFGYAYYGRKCFAYLFGAHRARLYDVLYVATLVVGAVWAADLVVNLLDTAFALMAFPNMLAVLILSPHVMGAARDYFARMRAGAF
jgi:AGCS family alanine or glycine:cation symporter